MPTPDDRELSARSPRRPLGRGPGAGRPRPGATADDPAPQTVPKAPDASKTPPVPDVPAADSGAAEAADRSPAGPETAPETARHPGAPAAPGPPRPAGTPPQDVGGPAAGTGPVQDTRPGPQEGGAPATGGDGESAPAEETEDDNRFTVRLDNFEGPFDLLLQLISDRKSVV